MNESIIESTEFVDRSLGLVSFEYDDKIRKIKMRETSFMATNGKYLEYLKKKEQVKTESNVSKDNVIIDEGLIVPAPIKRLSKAVDIVPVDGQYSIIDFHPIKLRASMMENARANGVSAYNTSVSNNSTNIESDDMFNVGVETSIPVNSDGDSVTSNETNNDSMLVIDNNESSVVREPIEVVPSREDSESYANNINSAFENEKAEDSAISVEPIDNSGIEVEPVTVSPADVKATVGSGVKLDVASEQEATPISPEEVEDVVGDSQELSSDEISELVNKSLNSLEPVVSKNNTHAARVNNFDGDGNYLGGFGNEDVENIETTPIVEQPVVFPKIQFKMPELKFGDVFSPVSSENVDNTFSSNIDKASEVEMTTENETRNDSNIRGDIVVVPDRPIVLNEKAKDSITDEEGIEDFVVVDDFDDEKQENFEPSSSDVSVSEEVQVEDDNINSNDGDLQFDFSGATLKDINGAVDSVNSKSSLEDLKDRISLLLKEKEAKSKELESARKKAEEAEKQREAARKAREDAIRSLDVYRQELENSVAMVAQQSDEIEKQAEATLTEADMDFMVAEEASSLLDSVNGNEHVGGMRRAA